VSDSTERADESVALKSADVQFPHVSEEERNHRIMNEVTRLASLAPGEWRLWYERSAERLDIDPNKLAELIQAQIEAREQTERKTQAVARLGEQRAHRLTSDEGHVWMPTFDAMPVSVRRRLRNSPYNCCAACLEAFVLPKVQLKHRGYSREQALLVAVEAMEAEIRRGKEA
jgi:hypothetical protein